uniref:Uncharacterized protein n=1 Tax=Oryza barthii TaxID=65489 RepID=A0A0D3F799_9ORYZ
MLVSPPTSATAAAARLRGRGGVRCTVAVTRFVVGSTKPCLGLSLVHVAWSSGGHRGPYFERLEEVGSVALDELVWEEAEQGSSATVLNPLDAAEKRTHLLAGATFLTQTCAVDVVYTHACSGENRGEGDATAAARRPVAEQMAVSTRWLLRRSRPTMRSGRKKRHPRRCQRGGHRTWRREVWP